MGAIVVFGVTGNVGSRVARKLAAHGHEVRGVARDPSRFPGEGVELVAADATEPDRARRALEGAESAYVTPPESGEDPLGLETSVATNVIEAAGQVGLTHLVVHTVVHADRGDTGAGILDNKHPIERAVQESGIPYTIIRPGWFFQNLFGAKQYLEQGMFVMPWPGDLAWAGTSVEDVSRAIVGFLESGPANRGFDVHVEGGVTGAGIAEAARRVLGRPVAYQEFPGSAREAVEPYPISEPHKDLYAELFEYFTKVEYLGDPETIKEALPDFRYTTVEEFLRTELFADG